jgi:hypothetical protein
MVIDVWDEAANGAVVSTRRFTGELLRERGHTVAVLAGARRPQAFSPSKAQSAAQQTKDNAECQAVAVQQSGFDPAKAQAVAAQPRQAAGGSE